MSNALVARTALDDLVGFLRCFDTEGTGLIPYGPPKYWGYHPARPFAFAWCDEEGNTGYFRWEVDPQTRAIIPGPAHEREAMIRVLTNPRILLIGHNIAYDIRMAEAIFGIEITCQVHDTMILAHVVTAGDELTYALKPLSKKYLDFPDDDEKQLERAVAMARRWAKEQGYLIAGGKKEVERGDFVVFAGNKPVKADYWLGPPDMCQTYAVGDVERAMMLFLLWMEELDQNPQMAATYRREMHLFHVLRRMERRGTRVYPDTTMHLIRWYRAYMKQMQAMAKANGGVVTVKKGKHHYAQQLMNFSSPKQLMQKFYEEKGYEVRYKERKKKNKETGAEEIVLTATLGKDELAEWGATDPDTGEFKDPLAKAILEYRSAHQTIKAFLNIYTKFWYPEEHPFLAYEREVSREEWNRALGQGVWVLHPNYNQTGAVTGRMTCSDPNLQQVASATTGLRKSEIPQRPRECFGPRPKCVWYLPDYSQVEVWVFAFMSGTLNMQRLLLSGHDFHQGVADKSFVLRDDYQARKKYYRKLAKLIMFGKLYGGGVGTPDKPGRMTKLLQMPFDEAKAFIDSFEEQFAEVVLYMKDVIKTAKRRREMYNAYGRLYRLQPDWAYKIVNYLVQGTCADVLKVATLRLDWMLRTRWNHPRLGLVNSIHDEMMIEVPDELHSKRLMREIMWVMQMDSFSLGLPVALPVGMKMTKPMYSFRERAYRQRWSDTMDVNVRFESVAEYWLANGIMDPEHNFRTKLGGVPYLPEEEEYFADLAAHMATCPFNPDIQVLDPIVKECVTDAENESGPIALVQRHLQNRGHHAA